MFELKLEFSFSFSCLQRLIIQLSLLDMLFDCLCLSICFQPWDMMMGRGWTVMTKPLPGNSRVMAAWSIGRKSTMSPARMRLRRRIEWQSKPEYVIRKQAVNQYSLMNAVIAYNPRMTASESAAMPASQLVSQLGNWKPFSIWIYLYRLKDVYQVNTITSCWIHKYSLIEFKWQFTASIPHPPTLILYWFFYRQSNT